MHLPMNQIEIQHLRRCLNIHRISEAEKIIWNFTNKFFFVWLPIRFLMPFSCFHRSICIIEFQFEDKILTLNFRPLVLRGQNFRGRALAWTLSWRALLLGLTLGTQKTVNLSCRAMSLYFFQICYTLKSSTNAEFLSAFTSRWHHYSFCSLAMVLIF